MEGRFHDGFSARVHAADVRREAGELVIEADGRTFRWSVTRLRVERHAGEVRLSHTAMRDARLVLAEADWKALAGAEAGRIEHRERRGQVRLAIALTATAAAVAALVFWGIPAASGPLARATPVGFEEGMGRNFELQLTSVFKTCEGASGQKALLALGDRLERRADTPFDIRVKAVEAPMVNAFALPGGLVLVTDDLIREAKSPDEVAAVVAHEVAHVEKRHVMQAVWRSLGFGLILDAVVGGGSGAGQQAVLLAGQMSETSYSRGQELEADRRGQALLHAEGLSSKGMAPFFLRLAAEEGRGEGEGPAVTEFLSTHPDSVRRARLARRTERDGAPAMDAQDWAAVQAACGPADPPLAEQVRRRLGIDRMGSPDAE